MSNWRENLKVGDQVIVISLRGNRVDVVKRLTKTQVCLEGTTTKYRINSGSDVSGDVWSSSQLIEPTEEKLSALADSKKRNNLIMKLKCIKWKLLKTKDLESIVDLIEKVSNESN